MPYEIITGKGKYRTSLFVRQKTLGEAKDLIKRIKAMNKIGHSRYVNPRIRKV